MATSHWRIAGALAGLVVAAGSLAPLSSAAAPSRLAASAVVSLLREDKPVFLNHATIRGNLNLAPLGIVRAPFTCRACVFESGISAARVTFVGTLDLRGSLVDGRFDATGATFQQPTLLGSVTGTRIDGPADFSSAVFANVVDFTNVEFRRAADFSLARFSDDTDFSGSRFRAAASFTSAVFARTASLPQAEFLGAASFAHVSFRGAAAFRHALFRASVSFASSTFRSTADFSGDDFGNVSFAGVTANGDLDFSSAVFRGVRLGTTSQRGAPIDFSDLTCSGTLSFDQASFSRDPPADFDRLSAHGLVMDVGTAHKIARATATGNSEFERAIERQLLTLTDTTAKARGQIATANNADYRLHVLASQTYSWPVRLADVVFYRLAAGYLVRPMRPLLTLLALAMFFSVIHTRRFFVPPRSPLSRRPRLARMRGTLLQLPTTVTNLLNECWSTIAIAFSRTALTDGDQGPVSLSRRLEVLAYRILAVCFLIGLANSNSTLRQLAHAVV